MAGENPPAVAGPLGRIRRVFRAEALKASRQPTLLTYALIVVLATALAGIVEGSHGDRDEKPADNGVATEDAGIFDSPASTSSEPAAETVEASAFPVFAAAARTGFLVSSLLILLFSAGLLAGEATGGTFRMLLVRPVTKTDVIAAKWLLAVSAVVVFSLLSTTVGYLVGHLFGTYGDVAPYTAAELTERAAVCAGITPLGLLAFAGLGLFLSSVFQSSASSVTAATLFGIGAFALNLFLTEGEQLLNPATYVFRYMDMLSSWSAGESSYTFALRLVRPALVVPAAYALAFLLVARIIFGRRDIHS